MMQLVNIFLRGAADGLSLLVPGDDPLYAQARPSLAIPSDQLLPCGIDGFGMHPAATHLGELLRERRAAVIPAAGFSGQTRSHFESQARLETAVGIDGNDSLASGLGWLAAILNQRSEQPAPFRAVAVGSVTLPMSLMGTVNAIGLSGKASLRLGSLRRASGRDGVVVTDSTLAPTVGRLRESWSNSSNSLETARAGARSACDVIERMASTEIPTLDPASFGTGSNAELFATAAAILGSDLGTEVVQIDLGGWDTHSNQGTLDGTFANLIAGLDAGIGGLIGWAGGADRLIITVMTEFGRRVQENASGGTDHGAGGLGFVIGGGVNGGLRGEWPGLASLDHGDLRGVNDLRQVQSEVVRRAFGITVPTPPGAGLGLFPTG